MQKSIYFSELKFNVATEFQTVILCLCFLKRVRKKVLESNEKKRMLMYTQNGTTQRAQTQQHV